MSRNMNIVLICVELICLVKLSYAYEVIYAVNSGGGAFTDSHGTFYDADPLEGKTGTASDFGKQLSIGRVPEEDELLYQTERYHVDSFHYDIPIPSDGEYTLVLKFSEVYFNSVDKKVFDVVLNSAHTIVKKLDIFKQVGKGVAHDEVIYFTVLRGMLRYERGESRVRNGQARLEFVKMNGFDNPKVNAIILFKGHNRKDLDQIPRIQSIEEYYDQGVKDKMDAYEPDEDTIRNIRDEVQQEAPKIRKTSGPKQQNPYALDDSSTMLPIFIAIGAFVPLLFCLCKM
ncbi:malectin-A [Sitodiplosis mosellana]|uniref:malectin-A n=1 Tax=Sitodiplosis mosellana TaxID=263140 RepID=UPI002443D4D2|nr:malectin-A [Sitodiplosis mosellana]